MAGSLPKSPGWYPDPDILPGSPSSLRYWNGRHWTDRRRPTPILTTMKFGGAASGPLPRALEGPARPAELPAPAAEVSAVRDGPGGRADTLDRPATAEVRDVELPTSAGGGRSGPPPPPEMGGGGGGDDGRGGDKPSPDGGARIRSRRKWWLLAAVGVLCAVLATLAGEAMMPKSPGPRVVTDTQWVKSANTLCANTLPTLRPADGGAFGSLVTPVQVANDIDQAATGLDKLANQLAALPIIATDKPYVTTWLNEWRQYDAIGRQYAASLRAGLTKKAPPILGTGDNLAKEADDFAAANDLKSCNFTYVDTSDASDM